MSDEKYHKLSGSTLPVSGRGVLYWVEGDKEAVQFWCPCGHRRVYVTAPPHEIKFDSNGILQSLGGSCGYKANPIRPNNWCHFTIKDGLVDTIHSDAKCPGGTGEIK